MKHHLFFWPLCALSLCAIPADAPTGKLVHIPNGISTIDFTGDGQPDVVVSAHRDNFNAQGFDVVTFYTQVNDEEHSRQLQSIPIFRAGKESREVTVSGGAACLLHDFRLLAGAKPDSAMLVLADRKFGDSYIAERKVTFTYLELRKNAEGIPGRPAYSFTQTRVTTSVAKYCDVGEAFKNELHL